ncbi:MAG: class I SAM-dependent methyltransferase [Chloroflexota bacterium]
MNDMLDFAELWKTQKLQDADGRLDAEVDLAFWQNHASRYDNCTAPPGSYDQTLRALQELVRPNDTLLDVGAGTGRFAIPLAHHVQQITALDHARPMLDILQEKVQRERLSNIALVETAWESADVVPHDVVLAAWSLYRLFDLTAAMRKLVETARRTLIIVESDDDATVLPHYPLMKEIWGPTKRPALPKHLCFLGVLWQIGIFADMQVVYETRTLSAKSPQQLAYQLAPEHALPLEVERFTQDLRPQFTQKADSWYYHFTYPVKILIWQRVGGAMSSAPLKP